MTRYLDEAAPLIAFYNRYGTLDHPSKPKRSPDYATALWKFLAHSLNVVNPPEDKYIGALRDYNPDNRSEEDAKRARGVELAALKFALRDTKFLFESNAEVETDLDPAITSLNTVYQCLDLDLAARLLAQTIGEDALLAVGLASATFQWELRSNFLGAILQLLDTNRDCATYFFTLMHPNWKVPVCDLSKARVAARRQLRLDLRRWGVTPEGGFLIAYNDVEFNPVDHSLQMYFSGMVTGAKAPKLRSAVGGNGRGSIFWHHGVNEAGCYSFDATAAALGKFWPIQTWGEFGYRLKPGNHAVNPELQLQYQRYYLSWLDNLQFLDLFLFDGIELWDGEMHLTQYDRR